MYILVIVTYLGGYTVGPNVTMQDYMSAESCFYAKEKTMAMIDGLLQANLQGYRLVQKSAFAECVKK